MSAKSSRKLTYVSLFSSAGIGCYGFKQEGFDCIATNEYLEKRLEIQKFNKKCKFESGYVGGDIACEEVKSKIYTEIDKWKKEFSIEGPDVLIATPPCQGMSVANHKKGNETKRNSLVVESIKLTKEILPKFFVFENVRSFLTTICTDVDGNDRTILDAINGSLAGYYNIASRVINFKDYGSNSSRTRTLVVGVRKGLVNISPYDLFPQPSSAKTLKELIFDLPKLSEMGEISEKDIFHGYRNYDQRMLPWIELLEEGQSAFENTDPDRIPHRIIGGKRVYNKSKNGDKYSRWYWDRPGPCIHTRNDILASQSTVHPRDNRVFSIRELMRMMTIPDSFQWSVFSEKVLNGFSQDEKRGFLKQHELNIRHCIGESVPTEIFRKIAGNVKSLLKYKELTQKEVESIVEKNGLNEVDKLLAFLEQNFSTLPLNTSFLISEYANANRQHTAAFFTRKDIVYSVIKDLPELKNKKIRILEPSVGVGNFIPTIVEKYKICKELIIDVIDVDRNSLRVLAFFLGKLNLPDNVIVNLIEADFLLWNPSFKYDLVIGNPPYKKITGDLKTLNNYKQNVINKDTNNLFSFFIEKSLKIGCFVSLIVPKSLISTPELNKTREILISHNLLKICDYGEKAFKGVKIETISFLVETSSKKMNKEIIIESFILDDYRYQKKSYIFDKSLPYWILYRDDKFDAVLNKLDLGVFKAFRDRKITKKYTSSSGKIRVLKSRNVKSNKVENIDGYDCYVDEIAEFPVKSYLDQENVVMIPNLTYYPRASFLPKGTITDGSVALLTVKDGLRQPTSKDLEYYATEEFYYYYRVARNYGTRSLNIDNNSVYFFGLIK